MPKVWLVKSNGKGLDFGSDTHRSLFYEDLKNNVGKTYRIERPTPKRSLSHNNFFWLYLEIIERETGNSTKDMHDYTVKYLTPKVERTVRLLEDGKWVEHKGMAGKGTSELNTTEMFDVIDKLGALTGVPIPDPKIAGYVSNY